MLKAMRAGQDNATQPTRLFIHGFTGSPTSWEGVCAHLNDTHEHVGMRLLGHHPTVPAKELIGSPHAPGAFERVVVAMSGALAALPERTFHMIGYSLGARLALGMLLHAPERFAKVTLLGGHPGLQSPAARASRAQIDAGWERMLREEGLPVFMHRWLGQPLFARLAHLPKSAMAADLGLRGQHDAAGLADALAATSLARMPSQWSALESVLTPVCFVAGAEDEKFVSLLQAAHRCTPGSMLQTIPGAGHNVLLEAPRLVARLIVAMEKRAQ